MTKATFLILAFVCVLASLMTAGGTSRSQASEPGAGGFSCYDAAATFDPLVISGCYYGLAQGADAMLVYGRAILRDNYASGDAVQALVDGQNCSTTVSEGGGYSPFELRISGASEMSGCAQDGDVVSFRIGGVDASETLVFHHFSPVLISLTAMPDVAWYWSQSVRAGEPIVGTLVEALVGKMSCGQATITRDPQGFASRKKDLYGFSKLILRATDQH